MRPVLPSEHNRKRRSFATSRAHVIVQIWRDSDAAEENVDGAGVVVRSGEQGVRPLREMPARFWQSDEQDAEQDFGDEKESAAHWTFRFNEECFDADFPDIQSDDEIRVGTRIFQVTNAGGQSSSSIHRDVRAVEIKEAQSQTL